MINTAVVLLLTVLKGYMSAAQDKLTSFRKESKQINGVYHRFSVYVSLTSLFLPPDACQHVGPRQTPDRITTAAHK